MRAALTIALALIVACGSPATTSSGSPAQSPAGSTAVVAASAAPSSAAPSAASILGIALTDVRTGERFTLGGFAGQTVIVEGMAVW